MRHGLLTGWLWDNRLRAVEAFVRVVGMAAPFPTSGQVDNVCTKSVRPDDIMNDRNWSNPAVHGAGTKRVIFIH